MEPPTTARRGSTADMASAPLGACTIRGWREPWAGSQYLVERFGQAGRGPPQIRGEVLSFGCDGDAGSEHGASLGGASHGLDVTRIELSDEAVAGELAELEARFTAVAPISTATAGSSTTSTRTSPRAETSPRSSPTPWRTSSRRGGRRPDATRCCRSTTGVSRAAAQLAGRGATPVPFVVSRPRHLRHKHIFSIG